jgi:hypothetical protein
MGDAQRGGKAVFMKAVPEVSAGVEGASLPL